jgi:hypothetical protein
MESPETMNAADFFTDVKRRVSRKCQASDPLEEARRVLGASGLTAEGQMVRKAVVALGAHDGEFGDSDIHRLGADALALVSALIDARNTRRYPDGDWLAAGAVS